MKTSHQPTTLVLFFALLSLLATTTVAAMTLPEKLAPVPVYSGAKIVQVMEMGTSAMAMLEAKTTPQALLEFYKKEMEGKGWKTAFQAQQEDSAVIHFTKGKDAVQITAGNGDEGMTSYQMVFVAQ